MKRIQITPELYTIIKGMISTGKKDKEVAAFIGTSRSTIVRIRNSSTFEGYRETMAKRRQESRERMAAQINLINELEHPEVYMDAERIKPNDDDLCGLLRENNAIMTMVHEKLTWIVDMLR